jgi:hypothetical protein
MITAAIKGAVLNGAKSFIVADCQRLRNSAVTACQRAVSADHRVDARIYSPVIVSDILISSVIID